MFGDECLGVGEFDRGAAGDLGEHPDPYSSMKVFSALPATTCLRILPVALRGSGSVRISQCAGPCGKRGSADERGEFVRGDIGVVEGHDVGLDLLAEFAVIDPEHDDLADGRVFVEPVLDLDRIDVLATSDDEIGAAARKEEQPVLDAAEVAGSEPSARSDRVGGRLGLSQ